MKKYDKIVNFLSFMVISLLLLLIASATYKKNRRLEIQILENKIDSLEYELKRDSLHINKLYDSIDDYQLKIDGTYHFFETIKNIESSNGVKTIGDNGKALGSYQIWNICVQDVNEYYGTNFTHNQMFIDSLAEQVMVLYLNKGCLLYYKKYNKYPDSFSILARMWNGGIYKGYLTHTTDEYILKLNKLI